MYAEPGLQFWDTARLYSNSDALGEEWQICSTNACSEQMLDPWGQCTLGHANWATLNLNLEVCN
jgi:hypothetical protein